MSRYILYGFALSTYVRTVRMALTAKGVDYDHVPVSVLAGENRASDHMARHPFGKVPTFEVDGTGFYETSAILEIIEGENPSPALFPADTFERARMRQWMSVIDGQIYPTAVGKVVWERLIKPKLDQTPDDTVVQAALPDVSYQFRLLDTQLDATRFLAGNTVSAADLYLAPIMAYVSMTPDAGELMGATPNLARWWADIQELESFRKTDPF